MWWKYAYCRGMGCLLFFGASGEETVTQRRRREGRAKAMCAECPVIVECLADALKFNDEGVRGGLTRYERQQTALVPPVVGAWVLIARSAGFRGNCTMERRDAADAAAPTFRIRREDAVLKQTMDETEAWIALHNADL